MGARVKIEAERGVLHDPCEFVLHFLDRLVRARSLKIKNDRDSLGERRGKSCDPRNCAKGKKTPKEETRLRMDYISARPSPPVRETTSMPSFLFALAATLVDSVN